MKYCLRYTNINSKLNKSDEITIKYIEDKGLLNFLERHKSAERINLLIQTKYFPDSELNKLIAIKKTYPQCNFSAALDGLNFYLAKSFKDAGIPFYVAEPCLDWEMLNILIASGVSDINISGPLGFELTKVRKFVGQDIKLRATPNKVTFLYPMRTDPLIGFFIRPEDTEVYEGLIDIFDFEGLEHQDTFYSIYAEQKMFIGHLNQCIYNFNRPIDNKGLIKLFGERRKNCGRQCLSGGPCQRCYSLVHIADLKSNDIHQSMLSTFEKEKQKLESLTEN